MKSSAGKSCSCVVVVVLLTITTILPFGHGFASYTNTGAGAATTRATLRQRSQNQVPPSPLQHPVPHVTTATLPHPRYAFGPSLLGPADDGYGTTTTTPVIPMVTTIGGAGQLGVLPWSTAPAYFPPVVPHASALTTTAAAGWRPSAGAVLPGAAAVLHWPQGSSVATRPANAGVSSISNRIQQFGTTLFAKYMKALKEKPLMTKCFSAAVVQTLGDLLSQKISSVFLSGGGMSAPLVFDWARTLSFALTGFLFNAPYLHQWFSIIAQYGNKVQRKFGLSENQRVGAELALDQSIGVFIYFPLYFYVYELCAAIAYWRVPQLGAITANGIGTILNAIKASYFFWPWMQLVAFKAIPEQLRVMFNNLVSVVWNIFFCAMVAG